MLNAQLTRDTLKGKQAMGTTSVDKSRRAGSVLAAEEWNLDYGSLSRINLPGYCSSEVLKKPHARRTAPEIVMGGAWLCLTFCAFVGGIWRTDCFLWCFLSFLPTTTHHLRVYAKIDWNSLKTSYISIRVRAIFFHTASDFSLISVGISTFENNPNGIWF